MKLLRLGGRGKALLIVLFLLVLVFAGQVGKKERVAVFELERLIVACSNKESGELDFSCFRSKITPLVTKDALPEIMRSLNALYLRPEGLSSCHNPAHIVGEVAADKGLSLSEIGEICNKSCGYGCEHGAFIQELRKEGNLLAALSSSCKPSEGVDKASCYHIVGHGLAEVFQNDISEAFEVCNGFPGWQINCGDGVLMEYLQGSPNTKLAGTSFESEEGLLSFCQSLPEPHKTSCFNQAGFYAYSLVRDKKSEAEICQKVPKEQARSCIYYLGSRVYFEFRDSGARLLDFCSQFQEAAYECVKGAIETDASLDSQASFSRELCASLGSEKQEGCLSFLNEKLEWFHEAN